MSRRAVESGLRGPVVWRLAVLALAAAPLAAQAPNHAQGFRPEHVFEAGPVENVDLANGNVTLTIALGGSYPVGPELSFGPILLTWTGNLWDWEERVKGFESYLQAEPRARSNAGFGWSVNPLGRYLGPEDLPNTSPGPVYESPDQALHELQQGVLHPGQQDFGSVVRFTHDGTYWRYQEASARLESPDGTVRSFDDQGRVVRIEDPFGNEVDVNYPASPTHPGVTDQRFTDAHGRSHRIYFRPAVFYGTVVERVDVEAFGGGTASYSFSYSNQSVTRPCTVPASCSGEPCGNTSPVTLPLLTKVSLPDGSAYSMPPGFYELGQVSACPNDQRMINGQLERLDLPTGGAFEWDWKIWLYPTGSGRLSPMSKDYGGANPFRRSVGLAERRRMSRSNEELGHWSYTPSLHPSSDLNPEELQVEVLSQPPGDKTVHYFSVWPGRSPGEDLPPGGWTRHEYGLPLTRYQTDGTSPGRFLSREVYNKDGTKLRSVYVRYERSGDSKANPRVVSQRTVYHDDGGRVADQALAGFDGLGQHRTVTTGGGFPGENVRTTTTNWNPGRSVSNIPGPTEPWVLTTFDSRKVTQGSQTVTQELDFDASGFLRRTRTRKGAACGGADVIVKRTRFPNSHATHPGFLAREDIYGGDGAGLPCGDLASVTLPARPEYRRRHTYACGSLASTRWFEPSGDSALSFLSLDRTIDCSTGLASASRDTAGLQTTITYDALGRITKEDLPVNQGADTHYTYNREGTSGLPARVTLQQKNGSTVLTEEQLRFDGFGRVAEERRKLPGGTFAVRKTAWNALGLIDQRSEWEADGDPERSVTRFRQYDPFGRPGRILLPAGQAIDLGYFGESRRTLDVPVATALGPTGEPVTSTARTTEVYDRFGRLLRLHEPTGTRTSYTYDAQGNLTRVAMNDTDSPTQTRTFTYDGRGFLTAESHPELGTSVLYSDLDPLGNPGRVRRGGWDLAYSYDAASRLTEIRERGTTRVWKSWEYATANFQAGQWSNGKLESAVRHNRVFVPGTATEIEVPVTEDHEYGGVGGRISKVTTTVGLGNPDPPESSRPVFHYQLSYDSLGNVSSRIQPRCDFNFCSASGSTANPFRAVSQTFTEGLLTAVPGYASSITYHPNGLFAQVAHTNGVTDLQENDPTDMTRPRRLRTTGASEDYDAGLYAWDGAGNVTKMGNHRYVYDLLSRVKDARVEVPGEGCGAELVLDSGTETGTATHQSCGTVRAQGSYGVGSTGDVTLTAGKRVVLGDGFSVASGGRLTVGTDPALDPGGEPAEASQDYTYDRFGNLLTVTTSREGQADQARTIGTVSSTNRLSVATYDLSGNVTSWAGRQYRWDAFNMLTQTKPTAGGGHTFLYGPGDERVLAIDWTQGTACQNWIESWTLRDLDGTPLRQFRGGGCNDSTADWSFQRDYIYRGGALLAANTPQGLRHFHLDHLGSPRLLTDASGTTLAQHLYFPFGEEATDPGQNTEALKFTGHERDDLDLGGTTADLDYMHRRYYSLHLGRFLSVDTAGGAADLPQSWNRYSYAFNNPVNYIDPTGEFPWEAIGQIGWDHLQCVLNGGCDFVEVTETAPSFNPLTGVQGLQDLRSGRSMFSSLIDRGLQSTRSYYQRRFEQQVAQGNEIAAFIDFMGLELLFPENSDELGGEVVLSMLPGGKLAKGLTKNFKYMVKKLGLNPKKASEALHAAKKAEGHRADVLFDMETGDIIAPKTGEVLGNLRDAY